MHNFSLWQMVSDASVIVQLVLLLLLAASILSWTITIDKWRKLKALNKDAKKFLTQFWSGNNTKQLRQRKNSNLSAIFNSAITRLEQLETTSLDTTARLQSAHERMQLAIEQQQQDLTQDLNNLATIGSISPYVGLFGTVWGILNTFQNLGNLGGATLNQVAPGIAEALVATAFGLLVAIPAVIAYNKLNRKINDITLQAEHFAIDLYTTLETQLNSESKACAADA